jgi:hypothetical protein
MDGQLPDYWTDAEHCGNGQPWGPGKVLITWQRRQCDLARKARPRSSGHRIIAYRAPGCSRKDNDPPHDLATGLGKQGFVSGRRGSTAVTTATR